MYIPRQNEPDYARLEDSSGQVQNLYGKTIETVPPGDRLRGQSLNINGDTGVSDNPNRYKKHGFYFNADNCIACHACEAACSEKNDNPAHLAFRSVGVIEGGSYPNMARLNISMACNHCDYPVCLAGCPTRAYTKFAEYGAVLQDPDICFGCGYCTWVCPYNAPQLDPVKGVVSKCNMCVDRLEAGMKPACVSACLGKALDFGVVESIPRGRIEAKTDIPGFPTPDITHPNVRFQQTRTLARDMARIDSTPVKYHRDEDSGGYRPELHPKHGFARHWNLGKLLGSHENAHIAFTLSAQAVAGAFLLLTLGTAVPGPLKAMQNGPAWLPSLAAMLGLLIFGMLKLNLHLGRAHRFYRGYYNLRYSPVSREIAGVTGFAVGLAGYFPLAVFRSAGKDIARWLGIDGYVPAAWFDHPVGPVMQDICAGIGLLGVAFGGYYMIKLYRIKARPFWNHWQTDASFVGATLSLGPLLLAAVALTLGVASSDLTHVLAGTAAVGLALEGAGLVAHARDLRRSPSEGAASFYEQATTYGYPYLLRNGLLAAALLLAAYLAVAPGGHGFLLALLAGLALVQSMLGRALFYVLVIPTTLPGAFFWRNPGFTEHARQTGLAKMPQVGVAYAHHHPFRLGELVQTVMKTSVRQKLGQAKRIFTG